MSQGTWEKRSGQSKGRKDLHGGGIVNILATRREDLIGLDRDINNLLRRERRHLQEVVG